MTIKSTVPSFASHPDSVLYRVRRDRGMSIEALSTRTSIHPDVLRYWERNNKYPTGETLRKVARVLQVKAGVLAGKKPFVPQQCDIRDPKALPSPTRPPEWFVAATKRIRTLFPIQ